GRIHRATGVNTAAAAQNTSNGFPVACGTAQVQSPVCWDNQIVTGSADGKIYRIDLSGATPYGCIGSSSSGAGAATVGGGPAAPGPRLAKQKHIVSPKNAQ